MPLELITVECQPCWVLSVANEGLAVALIILGVLLLIGFYLGPKTEVRKIKRDEGKIMLIPSAIILFVLAVIFLSGIIS